MGIEWWRHGRPSALGTATGAVAGLAAVTPASGYVSAVGGLIIGIAAGAVCYTASTVVKRRFGYDDSLDVFGVHGVGGFLGTILVGLLAVPALGGQVEGARALHQLGVQALAAVLTVVYTAAVTAALLKLVDACVGLRVDAEQETQGLDLSLHDEAGYNL